MKHALLLLALFFAFVAGLPAHPSQSKQSNKASKSFKLPDSHTSTRKSDPPFKAHGKPKNDHFKVKHHHDHGRLHDPHSPWHVKRDLPNICSIGHRTFWFFDDTFAYSSDGTFVGAASNSFSIAASIDEPSNVTDISITNAGDVTVAIPWFSKEAKVQYLSTRYALWSFAPCIPVDDHHAAQIWGVIKFDSRTNHSTIGYSVSTYEYDEDGNSLSITREQEIDISIDSFAYGGFSSIVVNSVIYLYALDVKHGRHDIHVAQVPRSSYADKSTWQYWDNGLQEWKSTEPNGSERQEDKAVITNSLPFSSGSVFFSEYHNSYLLVFFSFWADSKFYALSAPSPLGPWNVSNSVIYHTKPGENGYNYGGQASPLFTSSDEPIGKKLVLSYTYQDTTSEWYPKTETIEFE
ncbi:hypothetical protein V1514DRAFT_278893 [Lipomyces japonicus]|uniref:uncharacterized protein n=1 Tax=Lipomyces japonicus TaxID=56871 RepID=UPI0034CD40C7